MTILCQMNSEGFKAKPTSLQFYGKLREKMIQRGWVNLDEDEFVRKVTNEGYAFYGNIFDGHDLMELGQQRLCWRAQTMVGVDIDHALVDPLDIIQEYHRIGLTPWLVYGTFSDGDLLRSFRLLWKVEVDLNRSYEEWKAVIKGLNAVIGTLGDKHAQDCTRMWQGSDQGVIYRNPTAKKVPYAEFIETLGL